MLNEVTYFFSYGVFTLVYAYDTYFAFKDKMRIVLMIECSQALGLRKSAKPFYGFCFNHKPPNKTKRSGIALTRAFSGLNYAIPLSL